MWFLLKVKLLDTLLSPSLLQFGKCLLCSLTFFFGDGSTSKVTPSWPLLFLLATMSESAEIVSVLFFNYGCRC